MAVGRLRSGRNSTILSAAVSAERSGVPEGALRKTAPGPEKTAGILDRGGHRAQSKFQFLLDDRIFDHRLDTCAASA